MGRVDPHTAKLHTLLISPEHETNQLCVPCSPSTRVVSWNQEWGCSDVRC